MSETSRIFLWFWAAFLSSELFFVILINYVNADIHGAAIPLSIMVSTIFGALFPTIEGTRP